MREKHSSGQTCDQLTYPGGSVSRDDAVAHSQDVVVEDRAPVLQLLVGQQVITKSNKSSPLYTREVRCGEQPHARLWPTYVLGLEPLPVETQESHDTKSESETNLGSVGGWLTELLYYHCSLPTTERREEEL